MSIKAYENIPDQTLDQVHTTKDGKTYTIRCSDDLAVDMNYVGKSQSNANSQGWERNSQKYFEQLSQNHPEMFSSKNMARIQNNQAPIVDQKMIDHNPQYGQFRGDTMVHHHVGGDGQAVALPSGMHKGFGEIHNHEKNAGITQNCQNFSQKCANHAQNDPSVMGKNASEMNTLVNGQQSQATSQSSQSTSSKNAAPKNTSQANANGSAKGSSNGPSRSNTARTSAVNSVTGSKSSQSSTQARSSRSDAVNSVTSSSSSQSSTQARSSRSGAVNSVTSSTGSSAGRSSGGQSSGGGQGR